MWKIFYFMANFGLCILILFPPFGYTTSARQHRDATSGSETSAYSKLNSQELTDRTKALVKGLRSLHEEFKQAINGTSGGNRSQNSKLPALDAIQSEYDQKFAAQAREVEKELLKRLPAEAKPKDPPSAIASMLIKNGRLVGANPVDTIASYIEGLLANLPKATASPQK